MVLFCFLLIMVIIVLLIYIHFLRLKCDDLVIQNDLLDSLINNIMKKLN
jgi:hypothetical protein